MKKISNWLAIAIPGIVIIGVWFGIHQPPGLIQSVSHKSGLALLAVVVLWSAARLLDLIGGTDFKDWWHEASPEQKGSYYRIRLCALAVLCGFIIAVA